MAEPARILIIDDEESARYGMRRALGSLACELEEAADGASALAHVDDFRPDVIVSDINMPGMDGLTLVREVSRRDDPPLVVLVTAYGSEEIAVEALRSGAHNYIAKPFDLEELRLVVQGALEKQRLIRDNRRYFTELEKTLKELRDSQAALVQAEKMASLGRLVAGLAHEIHTPLGVLQSCADTISRAAARVAEWRAGQGAGGDLGLYLETIRETAAQMLPACERMSSIVTNLRQFAQLDRAEFQRAAIVPGLQSTIELLRHEIGEQGEVDAEFEDLPDIDCSPRQLNQLLMNLLLNAKEAVERTGRKGRIRVSARQVGENVQLDVSDDGCGIPVEDQPRIFDPGFTTKHVRFGAGLGLAICYQIVRAHQGRIDVHGSPGTGARFTVTLPIRSGTGTP